MTQTTIDLKEPGLYTVRLVFAELEDRAVGERVFDVAIQDKEVLNGLDIAREAGGTNRTLLREFSHVEVHRWLTIDLKPRRLDGPGTLISGVEILREAEANQK